MNSAKTKSPLAPSKFQIKRPKHRRSLLKILSKNSHSPYQNLKLRNILRKGSIWQIKSKRKVVTLILMGSITLINSFKARARMDPSITSKRPFLSSRRWFSSTSRNSNSEKLKGRPTRSSYSYKTRLKLNEKLAPKMPIAQGKLTNLLSKNSLWLPMKDLISRKRWLIGRSKNSLKKILWVLFNRRSKSSSSKKRRRLIRKRKKLNNLSNKSLSHQRKWPFFRLDFPRDQGAKWCGSWKTRILKVEPLLAFRIPEIKLLMPKMFNSQRTLSIRKFLVMLFLMKTPLKWKRLSFVWSATRASTVPRHPKTTCTAQVTKASRWLNWPDTNRKWKRVCFLSRETPNLTNGTQCYRESSRSSSNLS